MADIRNLLEDCRGRTGGCSGFFRHRKEDQDARCHREFWGVSIERWNRRSGQRIRGKSLRPSVSAREKQVSTSRFSQRRQAARVRLTLASQSIPFSKVPGLHLIRSDGSVHARGHFNLANEWRFIPSAAETPRDAVERKDGAPVGVCACGGAMPQENIVILKFVFKITIIPRNARRARRARPAVLRERSRPESKCGCGFYAGGAQSFAPAFGGKGLPPSRSSSPARPAHPVDAACAESRRGVMLRIRPLFHYSSIPISGGAWLSTVRRRG